MKEKRYDIKKTIVWMFVQICFLLLFLVLCYMQETSIIEYMSRDGAPQKHAIQNFLHSMQASFLPDYCYMLFPYLVVVSISLILFKRYRWLFLTVIGTIFAVLLSADKLYYNFFASVLSSSCLKALGHAWSAKSSIAGNLSPLDWLINLKFLIFYFFGILYNKNINSDLPDNPIAFSMDKTFGIIFFLLSIYCYNIAFFLPNKNVVVNENNNLAVLKRIPTTGNALPILPDYEISSRHYAATFGIMNFHVHDLIDSIFPKKEASILNETKYNELAGFFKKRKRLNDIGSPFRGIAKGRNVFLIHFESLSPILVNLSIDNKPVTPTLNTFLPDSLYWHNIIDQTKFGGSSDSEFSILTGMITDTQDFVIFNTDIIREMKALPKYLKKTGYKTISLHGFKSAFWNRNINHPLMGFDEMHFGKAFSSTQQLGWGIPDKEFFAQSANILSDYKNPFFAFLITLSTHAPYHVVPAGYDKFFTDSLKPESSLVHYLQLIRYTDDALGDFLKSIKEKDALWSNSMFIIYGDHKPALNEKDCDNLKELTGKSLFNPRYQCVPVIIILPGKEKLIREHKEEYKNVVGGLYDLFPTILHLLGMESPSGVFGTHLFVANDQRGVIPLIKYGNGFVLNGILYNGAQTIPYKDEKGYVFTNNTSDILKDHDQLIEAYKEYSRILRLDKTFFHGNLDINKFYSYLSRYQARGNPTR